MLVETRDPGTVASREKACSWMVKAHFPEGGYVAESKLRCFPPYYIQLLHPFLPNQGGRMVLVATFDSSLGDNLR